MLGWISGVFLALCGIPALLGVLQNNYKAKAYSSWFLWMWGIGEVAGIGYAVQLSSVPLFLNYVVNSGCIVVILYYNLRRE